jgi:Uma2 family endonuclease
MTKSLGWTSADLETLPDDGKRYEIIDGELFVSKQPHYNHQRTCTRLATRLEIWSNESKAGEVTQAPGLIFAEDDDVAPDIVWVSKERLESVLGADGKLHAAPELIIEVLSPGRSNEQRDREAKLALYSRRAVEEYWIADWRERQFEVYRREGDELRLTAILREGDTLESPLLPGFSCLIAELFAGMSSG